MGNRKNGSASSRAIVGLLLVTLILLGDIISATIGIASPIFIPKLNQRGVVQCTSNGAGDGPGCHGTITFPQPFAAMPNEYGINIDCLANLPQDLTSQNASKICATAEANGFVAHTVGNFIPAGSVTIFGGNFTWKNWKTGSPGATPCILPGGSTISNCDVGSLTNGGQQTALELALSFNCVAVAGVQTGNEWMALQYSNDPAGTTWINSGINDTDPGGFCSLVTPFISVISSPVIRGATPQAFRVIGGGGSGAGDNITFFTISVTVLVQNSVAMIANMGTANIGTVFNGKIQFPFYVQFYNSVYPNDIPIMTWWACTC